MQATIPMSSRDPQNQSASYRLSSMSTFAGGKALNSANGAPRIEPPRFLPETVEFVFHAALLSDFEACSYFSSASIGVM